MCAGFTVVFEACCVVAALFGILERLLELRCACTDSRSPLARGGRGVGLVGGTGGSSLLLTEAVFDAGGGGEV